MKRLLAAGLLMFAAVQSAAPQVLLAYETPIEATASLVTFPPSVPGQLMTRDCEACPAKALNVTASTRFFLKREEVTLDELRPLAYGTTSVGIYYLPEGNAVTRVVLNRERPRPTGRAR